VIMPTTVWRRRKNLYPFSPIWSSEQAQWLRSMRQARDGVLKRAEFEVNLLG
jgi:hypothetical protein